MSIAQVNCKGRTIHETYDSRCCYLRYRLWTGGGGRFERGARRQGGKADAASAALAQTIDKTSTSDSAVIRQQVSREPIEWKLTRGACPPLQDTTRGSGTGRVTTTVARNSNGTNNYAIVAEASGTATDSAGFHYIYLYTNTTYIDSASGLPYPNLPFTFYGPDVFQLIPVDGGSAYTTTIFFKGRVKADGSFVDQGTYATPNFPCDPI